MKKSILIQYGCFVRLVELPFPFSAASFEARLLSIFHFSGKDILGLRHPNETRILPLEEMESDDDVITFASECSQPCLLVFHSGILLYLLTWQIGCRVIVSKTRDYPGNPFCAISSPSSFVGSFTRWIGFTDTVDASQFALYSRCFFQVAFPFFDQRCRRHPIIPSLIWFHCHRAPQ